MNRNVGVMAIGALFGSFVFAPYTFSQSEQSKKSPKKVWTNDDLVEVSGPSYSPESRPLQPSMDTRDSTIKLHYDRSKDANWYVKQLSALRRQVQDIDRELKTTTETIRSGKGGNAGIALDKPREAATTDAEVEILHRHRSKLIATINDLESEAAKNDIAPGALRREMSEDEGAVGSTTEVESKSADLREADRILKEQQEHLKRANNELDLLSRRLDLDQRDVYSNPNYSLDKSGETKLRAIRQQIEQKHAEIGLVEQDIAKSEDHIEDLKLNQTADQESAKKQDDSVDAAKEEKGEDYWKRRFAEARYKLRIAEEERDILQRELGVLVVQYDPNPAKALFEGATNRKINEHRKAIDEKSAEIKSLRAQLSDLEDELSRAGGHAGWARE